MIAIARKNLSCLFINPNPFLCNSNALSFSTWREKRLIPVPEICDVLVNKHQFSPELASLASSRLPKFRDPQRTDSVLSFLKENCFTVTQLQKIVV
ncbi:transcription termination factor MTERF4, chloroplastic-like [Salvia divinorum]|uniref:Transcription termination factor MTERF4, chloroplastic-like n=1 Tax=Salvia divinorum TaxID=28513 RepID=A0ABD1GBS3_SALDI